MLLLGAGATHCGRVHPGDGAGHGFSTSPPKISSGSRSLWQALPRQPPPGQLHHLREGPRGTDPRSVPFTSLYQLHDEWAAEMADRTVHAVMHIGWVEDGTGGYRGQMAVLVKPNGLFGALYMAAVKPFRYVGVYPALFRATGRAWQANARERNAAARPGSEEGAARTT
ncbi:MULTISPECIES: DUF2867 domain-containing protein [Streptomyces]|uniref:DUF2867 domain-containing protein n=1 Tax=Streptomyces TaxID=1883 RepID=UPI00355805AC